MSRRKTAEPVYPYVDGRIQHPYYVHWEVVKRVGVVDEWLKWESFQQWIDKHHVADQQLTRIDKTLPHGPDNSVFGDKTVTAISDKPYSNNRSGRRGVVARPDGRWQAQITVQGKTRSLGYYDDFEDAVRAREAGERRYFKPLLERARQQITEGESA